MKKIKKYVLGFLFLLMFSISTQAFAFSKNNHPRGSLIRGTITSINDGSYTILIKKGSKITTKEIRFDSKTEFKKQKQKEKKSTKNNLNQDTKPQKFIKEKITGANFKVGDSVVVEGELNKDGKIEASSVRGLENQKIIIKNQTN